MIIRFSKSNMWCQELFMDTYVTDMTKLFFSNCKTSVLRMDIHPHQSLEISINLRRIRVAYIL